MVDQLSASPSAFACIQLPSAAPQQWALRGGVDAWQRPMAINADANAKNNHNQKCGASMTGEYEKQGVAQALKCRFFGKAGAVLEKYLPNQPRGGEEDGERRACTVVIPQQACLFCDIIWLCAHCFAAPCSECRHYGRVV